MLVFGMKRITGILLFLACVLFISLLIRGGQVLTTLAISTTNTSAVTVNVTAEAPVLEPVICYDADDTTDFIDLIGGSVRYAKCNTTANDVNGVYDMVTFMGQIQTGGGGACTASNTNCYVNTSCENTSAVNSTAFRVTCSYLFWYNADNTSKSGDWTGNITVVDSSGLEGYNTDTIDVQELLAIGVDPLLSFGSKSPSTNDSTVSVGHTLFNYGNIQMDFQVNGSVMSCDQGTIDEEYIKVNLTSGDPYDKAYPLTPTLGNSPYLRTFNLDENNTATTQAPRATSKETYWGIGIPSGILGDCQSTIWFAAIAS